MNLENQNKLVDCFDEKLRPYAFQRIDSTSFLKTPSVPAALKRKNWNTNRAIVAISLSEPNDWPGKFSQTVKMPIGKVLGYVPFFFPLGLQIILIGNSLLDKIDDLEQSLDKLDNQRVVLQSIHVVDLAYMKSVSVRTWGQYESGRFQDAIEKGIQTFLSPR